MDRHRGPAHFLGFVPLAVQGRDAGQRRGARRGQPAPPPGSAKTGRRRSTARYDGALTSASPSTGKDSSSLTVPVNRPAPADPDTSPPASRPIEAQLRAGNGAGRPARPRPGRDDVDNKRLSAVLEQIKVQQAGLPGASAARARCAAATADDLEAPVAAMKGAGAAPWCYRNAGRSPPNRPPSRRGEGGFLRDLKIYYDARRKR